MDGLIQLARDVLRYYTLPLSEIRLIQGGGVKAVWKFMSGGKDYCLKRLNRSMGKALFTVEAQNYIASRSGRVAPVVINTEGQSITEYNGELFVVYEWIKGRDLNFSHPDDLKTALQGLAYFHLASSGYMAPTESEVSSKLGRWPYHYQDIVARLELWREDQVAEGIPLPAKAVRNAFNRHADNMIALGEKCLTLLEASAYGAWVEEMKEQPILCHQDYGKGNCLYTDQGVYVLDLDSVTYDLPARDLRKIVVKQMNTRSLWDMALLNQLTAWYNYVYPLTEAQWKVLYIDCLFPHEFHAVAKNPFHKGKPIDASKLDKAAKLESKKVELLETLLS